MATEFRSARRRFVAATALSLTLVALGTVWVTRQAMTSGFHLTEATVVEDRGETASGLTRAMVAWTDDDGVERRRMMQLDPGDARTGTLPVWVPVDDPVEPRVAAHPDPFWESTFTWIVALGGLLVGFGMGMHAVGWSFISDDPKTTEELQESRGFYWRS